MMRVCHLNTCPVGIATQDPELRRRFTGLPDHVVRYLLFVAEGVRELMAEVGVRRFEDLVGRTDLLRPANADRWPWLKDLDLEPLLHRPGAPGPRTRTEQQDHGLAAAADHRWLVAARAAGRGEAVEISDVVRNTDRSVGAMLAGELAAHELDDDAVVLRLDGTGGQSFGAFAVRGMTLSLSGVVNDYCGKGLSGGRLVVAPAADAAYVAEDNVVCGNVALYGATSGEAFFRGVAGERFCVRNSGATAVVEGVGDHGCEYMTGGVVLVLGRIGRNFAAGMSGGTAYVLRDGLRTDLINDDSVGLVEVEDPELLAGLLEQHLRLTGSAVAARLLARPGALAQAFVQVLPHDLRHARATALEAAAVTAA
jgi:glutamate synthase domain-containing protein 3